MQRFLIGIATVLIVCSSGQAVAQLPDFEPGQVLRADDLNAIVERLNSLTSSPGDVAGTWVGTLSVSGSLDFSVRLDILHTPGQPHFEGSASYCTPVPCEPPVTAMATFTGRFIQGEFFALFPILTNVSPCAPGSFNVTGTFNETMDQMTMTGSGRNDDCRVGAFTGTFDKESSDFPVTVIISSPTQRKVFASGDPISFQAEALNAIGQEVSGSSLVWLSDKDGEIGTGNSFVRDNLSLGIHGITVAATKTDGITITVSSLSSTCLENLLIDGISTTSDITVAEVQDSTCTGSCEQEIKDRLQEAGVPYSSSYCCPDEPTACIGFDPSIGGTMEGAQCLVDLLGQPYRVDAACSSGFDAYQINLE